MKISDFKGEKGLAVAIDLIGPICKIVSNAKNLEAKGRNAVEFLGAMLKNSPEAAMEILAILNETEPAAYQCDGASALKGILDLATDQELMALFGLRRPAPVSSGPAQASTEAEAARETSAGTPKPKRSKACGVKASEAT